MNRTALLVAGFGLIGLGCSEFELKSTDKYEEVQENGDQPDIQVDPAAVSFGEISALTDAGGAPPPESITEVVTINNVGAADLHIADMYLDDDTSAFSVGSLSTVLVQPNGASQFTVTFEPLTSADYTASILIESDDPDEPTVEVPLTGVGVAPVIDVSPMEYDFGTLYIGCDTLQAVTVSNIGNADLTVYDFSMTTASDDLSFDSAEDIYGDLPWTLAPGDSVEVYMGFEPFDEYDDHAFLTITSNDPFNPSVAADYTGTGALYGENLDVFEQPIKGETDIIFAVDRSCSMSDDITNVQNNFESFVTTLAGMDADFQVAATVEDNGCINGSDLYIDNTFSASEATDAITAMINLGASYGSNTERAFMLLEATLANTGSGDCNDGLVRDDATLNLVMVSDEPEQSVNSYAYYVSTFQGLKANPDDVIIHAIGGDYPMGCGSASAYTGAYEATVATGGLFLSICATDWGAHLEALAEGSAADLTSFELTDWPVPSTIVVRIDGVTTTKGWEYNESINSIDFEDAYVPEGGSTIEVEYALYGDCEG